MGTSSLIKGMQTTTASNKSRNITRRQKEISGNQKQILEYKKLQTRKLCATFVKLYATLVEIVCREFECCTCSLFSGSAYYLHICWHMFSHVRAILGLLEQVLANTWPHKAKQGHAKTMLIYSSWILTA